MPTLDTRTLIDALQQQLRVQLAHVDALLDLPTERLLKRPAPDRWSVMEVVQHMNLSSGHYHRLLQRLYANENNGLRFRSTFTPGLLGQYSVNAMTPKSNGDIPMRMRTLRMFDPARTAPVNADDALAPLLRFREMLHGFMGLLERARTRGLEGEKVTSTLGPIIRFKAGDAFRFPIAHQERHFLQIDRVLKEV
ncbi:MAG: DinB family protein [Flavobacteriales bacterium]|nr:DinB family protein [Flavobacteriales bacterium]